MRKVVYALAPFVTVAMWSVAMAALASQNMIQGDTFWHLVSGHWIVGHRQLMAADPFSWTAAGQPWQNQEWLWDVLAYLGLLWAGKWGVWSLLTIGAVCFGIGVYALAAQYDRDWALPASMVSTFTACFFWSVRPHVLAMGVFALWFAMFAAAERYPRLAWFLPPLTALWSNMHGSAILAPMLALVWLGAEVIASRNILWPLPPRTMGVLGALAATGVNPWGYGIWTYSLRVAADPLFSNNIVEWVSPDFHLLWAELFLILIVVLLCLWPKAPVAHKAVVSATLVMSLLSRRHIPFFTFFWAAAVTAALPGALKAVVSPGARRAGLATVILASIFMLSTHIPPAWSLESTQEGAFPVAAVAWMKAHGAAERVFNYYSWGGYLIYEGVRPFVDGRADIYEFSGDALKDYFKATQSSNPTPGSVIDKWGVETVIFPSGSWIDLCLVKDGGWRCAYRDATAVVYIKTSERS